MQLVKPKIEDVQYIGFTTSVSRLNQTGAAALIFWIPNNPDTICWAIKLVEIKNFEDALKGQTRLRRNRLKQAAAELVNNFDLAAVVRSERPHLVDRLDQFEFFTAAHLSKTVEDAVPATRKGR